MKVIFLAPLIVGMIGCTRQALPDPKIDSVISPQAISLPVAIVSTLESTDINKSEMKVTSEEMSDAHDHSHHH